MGRDTTSLISISPKFTEETLKEILVKTSGSEHAAVAGWSVSPAASKGDNYMSVVYRVTIDGVVETRAVQCSVIVKALLGDKRKNEIFRSKDFFKNETAFYTKVVPLFMEFLESKGKGDFLNAPRCLAYNDDGENNFLALEDAKAKGFSHVPRSKPRSLEDCQLLFKTLAQFHAVSLALLDQRPSEFSNATKHLTETLYTDKLWYWIEKYYASVVDYAQDAVSRVYKDTQQEQQFNSMTTRGLFNKCLELMNKTPKRVVTHGDVWSTNFMIRSLESGEREAIVFDFQIARCGSPVYDLGNFIYTSTDKQTRDKHFHGLLRYYHAELGNHLLELGSNIVEVYSWDLFMKDVKEFFGIGLLISLPTIPSVILPESEAYNLDDIEENCDNCSVADVWKLRPIRNEEDLKRVADVVIHAIDEGFI